MLIPQQASNFRNVFRRFKLLMSKDLQQPVSIELVNQNIQWTGYFIFIFLFVETLFNPIYYQRLIT